jgi:hypothetical protein
LIIVLAHDGLALKSFLNLECDIAKLLTPQPWEAQQPLTLNIARQILGYRRMQRGLLSQDVAPRLEVSKYSLMLMENDKGQTGGDNFLSYQRYTNFLDITLTNLFQQASEDYYQNKLQRFEAGRLAEVQAIIHDLQEHGIPVTQQRVGEYIGVKPATLRNMPRIHACLRQAALEREGKTPQHEQALLEAIEHLVSKRRSNGKITSINAIVRKLKVSIERLRSFPRISARLDALLEENKQLRQDWADQLLAQVQAIVKQMEEKGITITINEVARELKVTDHYLRKYPTVHRYLKSVIIDPIVKRQQREAELVLQVREAIREGRNRLRQNVIKLRRTVIELRAGLPKA